MMVRYNLRYGTAGSDDLGLRPFADLDTTDGDSPRNFAVGQQLGRPFPRVDESCRRECLWRHFGPISHTREITDPYDLMLDTERIGESTLWETTRERHLTAFELRLATARTMMPCACL